MNSDPRLTTLQSWLATRFADGVFTLAPASEDASFRRYFRVSFADGRASLIAMDAPPGKEDCRPFLHVAGLFAAAGAHVPRVHAQNLTEGFLLLEDLGGTTYLERLRSAGEETGIAERLYAAAIDALIAIQLSGSAACLAPYDQPLLERELALFPDWYVARHLGIAMAPGDTQ